MADNSGPPETPKGPEFVAPRVDALRLHSPIPRGEAVGVERVPFQVMQGAEAKVPWKPA